MTNIKNGEKMNKFQTFCNDKNLSDSTTALYNACINLYEQCCNATLDELIKEADQEEEQGIRWKNRKLLQRLIQFRNYLYANKSEGTAKRYFSCIKTVYAHFLIEIHSLPSFNSKQVDKTFKMDYEDLLSKEELISAYYEANNTFKFLILTGISTGLSRADMLKMTVEEFIEPCIDYLQCIGIDTTPAKTLSEKLLLVKDHSDKIIPCFKGERQKNNSKYITFCSPEAVTHGVHYLIGRDAKIREKYNKASDDDKPCLPEKLEYDDRLFDVSTDHVTYTFQQINKKLNLGHAGKFIRCRCHMLRKYHASTLLNSEILTWTVDEIDTLQGRSMDLTHQAYFKNSKEKLFKKYEACVDELMLFQELHGVSCEDVEKLEYENMRYKNKLEEQQKTIDEIIKNQRELEAMLGL